MVKKTFFILLCAFFTGLFSAVFSANAEFTASVNSTQVSLNEAFSLSLTLKGASPKGTPAISALKEHFFIHSQQHSASTTIINGEVTSSITWKLSLTPKTEGSVQIPPLTIDTADGPFSTQPIPLNVNKGSSSPSSKDDVEPNIVTSVSNPSPYKNEPLLHTTVLTSKFPLYHLQTQKLQVEDAIVELLEEPKLEERVIEGVLLHVVELRYLITPLKTGSLAIPSIAVQGAIPQKRKKQFSSFFDDPFAMMQGVDLLPFTLMTEEISLDVQPALPEISPWLPARALTLEELWPLGQILRAGEPFSRGVLIQAEGPKAGQLPHLEDLQSQNAPFKVYADKPQEQENMVQGILHSTRKEQYTLIPQKAGTWTLPEISISWWDIVKKEKRTSILPARTVHILPALETITPVSQDIPVPSPAAATETPMSQARPPFLLYGIIGMLTCFLSAALFWGFTLRRKIASLTHDPSPKPKQPPAPKARKPVPPPANAVQKEKKEKLPDLNPT